MYYVFRFNMRTRKDKTEALCPLKFKTEEVKVLAYLLAKSLVPKLNTNWIMGATFCVLLFLTPS